MSSLHKQYEHQFQSKLGKQLYALLPEIYRVRDSVLQNETNRELGDLARFFDANGYLLDLVYNTLEQRLADSFPDDPASGEACQEWLIPYFARLVDARLVSSDPLARRAEVANAISWRQRKGTLVNIEDIASELLGDKVFLQEGINRVATTPIIGQPLLPLAAYGIDPEGIKGQRINSTNPAWAAKHPSLPACMLDMRCMSRVIQTGKILPTSKSLNIDGSEYQIRQVNHHGVPQFINNFDDVSRRTVDVRNPNWRVGHVHPNRVLVFEPTPMGLFPWSTIEINNIKDPIRNVVINHDIVKDDKENIPKVSLFIQQQGKHPVKIKLAAELPKDLESRWQNTVANLAFTKIQNIDFVDKLHIKSGKVHLSRVKAKEIIVEGGGVHDTVLQADNCLFEKITVTTGKISLENCTILTTTHCAAIEAKNCIFNGDIRHETDIDYPLVGEIKFSRIPVNLKEYACIGNTVDCSEQREHWTLEKVTTQSPSFFEQNYEQTGSGVLQPDSSQEIYQGADNAREMGVYNQGRLGQPVVIEGNKTLTIPNESNYSLDDLVFKDKLSISELSLGTLKLNRVAIRLLDIAKRIPFANNTIDTENKISIDAKSSLLGSLQDEQGTARLVYCTVLGEIKYIKLLASDSIFSDDTNNHFTKPTSDDCIRYSRIPPKIKALESPIDQIRFPSCTDELPLFMNTVLRNAADGEAGCGVLSQVVSANISEGAEDGGEMGAYHNFYYCAKRKALKDKLKMYLPYGIESALIYEQRLHEIPEKLEEKIGKEE